MDSGSNVSELAAELARAVEVTMSPTASQAQRMEAYVACEKYVKDDCIVKNVLITFSV